MTNREASRDGVLMSISAQHRMLSEKNERFFALEAGIEDEIFDVFLREYFKAEKCEFSDDR